MGCAPTCSHELLEKWHLRHVLGSIMSHMSSICSLFSWLTVVLLLQLCCLLGWLLALTPLISLDCRVVNSPHSSTSSGTCPPAR